MDLATIVGMFLGISLVGYAMLSGGGADAFISPQSVMIVIGGGIASVLTSVSLKNFLRSG